MKMTNKAALVQASIPISEPKVDPTTIIRGYQATPVSAIDLLDFEQVFSSFLLK